MTPVLRGAAVSLATALLLLAVTPTRGEERAPHPIDRLEGTCLAEAVSPIDTATCISRSTLLWEAELLRRLRALRETIGPDAMAPHEEAHDRWRIFRDAERHALDAVFGPEGAAASEPERARRERALVRQRARDLGALVAALQPGTDPDPARPDGRAGEAWLERVRPEQLEAVRSAKSLAQTVNAFHAPDDPARREIDALLIGAGLPVEIASLAPAWTCRRYDVRRDAIDVARPSACDVTRIGGESVLTVRDGSRQLSGVLLPREDGSVAYLARSGDAKQAASYGRGDPSHDAAGAFLARDDGRAVLVLDAAEDGYRLFELEPRR